MCMKSALSDKQKKNRYFELIKVGLTFKRNKKLHKVANKKINNGY